MPAPAAEPPRKDFTMASAIFAPMPASTGLVSRLERWRARAQRFPLSVLELGMRLAVGATFFRSGMNKAESFDTAITLFREEYRLPLLPPELAAWMGTAVELSAPILLVVGLFARLGAAALLIMTLTIQFLVYPANWPEHLMWASILAYVLTRGPGALSLDRIIAFNLFGRA
jgi:putative oxidoreductase